MNKIFINNVTGQINKLQRKEDIFDNVILDNWRGLRLIYSYSKCNNICSKCPIPKKSKEINKCRRLCNLLKTTKEDQNMFGKKNFMDCKSLEEYKACYVNFILEKCNSYEEILKELLVIKNLIFIYSRNGNVEENETLFKKNVITRTLSKCNTDKKKTILKILRRNKKLSYALNYKI